MIAVRIYNTNSTANSHSSAPAGGRMYFSMMDASRYMIGGNSILRQSEQLAPRHSCEKSGCQGAGPCMVFFFVYLKSVQPFEIKGFRQINGRTLQRSPVSALEVRTYDLSSQRRSHLREGRTRMRTLLFPCICSVVTAPGERDPSSLYF